MSRIGRKPVLVPQGVKVQMSGQKLHVEGPKGKLDFNVHPRMKVVFQESAITVSRPTNTPIDRSLHGMTRTLIHNMVKGVTEEFSKTLEIEGVGFRAQVQGKNLQLSLGFSHPIIYSVPDGIRVDAKIPSVVTVKGSDKALVGQAAADIRSFFKPEPYKGKGVRYAGEEIRKKAGKAAG
jgi:large subunit ribosomal protein L6